MTILQRGASINENIEVTTTRFDGQTLRPNINTFKEQYKENLLWLSDYTPDTLQKPNKASLPSSTMWLGTPEMDLTRDQPSSYLQNQQNNLSL